MEVNIDGFIDSIIEDTNIWSFRPTTFLTTDQFLGIIRVYDINETKGHFNPINRGVNFNIRMTVVGLSGLGCILVNVHQNSFVLEVQNLATNNKDYIANECTIPMVEWIKCRSRWILTDNEFENIWNNIFTFIFNVLSEPLIIHQTKKISGASKSLIHLELLNAQIIRSANCQEPLSTKIWGHQLRFEIKRIPLGLLTNFTNVAVIKI
jgi:hypothetical protein